MVQEFRDFIAKGNMIDIAVGFIMGAAFIAVVGALVENVLMPIIAIPFGEPSFDSIVWTINGSEILIGSFITAIVAFLLVALAVFFFIVKPYNAYRDSTTTDEEEDAGPTEVELLEQIRDSLAK
jgi:large conductance mechanosensitive channel